MHAQPSHCSPPLISRSLLPHWQRDVFQVNACPATTNTSACAHVHSGALQRGLVVGMEALAMVVTETLASRGLANQDVSVVEVGLPFGLWWTGAAHSLLRIPWACQLCGWPALTLGLLGANFRHGRL